ncbi:MAG: LuxR family transcriptional regulator [Mycobacteriales bacterium]
MAATPFVGRAADLAALERLVREPAVRLVTLMGPAGVGKTRLAIELSRRVAPETAHFVSMADVADPHLVGSALLAALGVPDAGAGDTVDRVAELLGVEPGLLVLDNFEQLLPAATAIAALLERCPGLTMLITSRHPLGIRVERTYPVAPLAVPASVSESLRCDAVALLLDRLVALDPTAAWDGDPELLAEICRRLDGLPLAIELAAARARVLTLEAIRDGLVRRLDLLGRSPVDLPGRQRTMRDALLWSYAMLPQDSAALFRRLGVCVGGANLQTVRLLAADLGLQGSVLLDALEDLVAHHLVMRTTGGRYRMLEVVRELALEQLAAGGELALASNRHARTFLDLAEEAAARVDGAEQLAWLDALAEDAPNLTSAVRHALATSDVKLAVRLCLALRFLWYVRGPLLEGQSFFAATLALPGVPEPLRTRALVEAAALARHRGALESAQALAEEGLASARALDDPALIATALLQTGFVRHLRGRYDQARTALEECLTIRQLADDRLGTARALHHLALTALHGEGNVGLAAALQDRCLALFLEIGNLRHVAATLIALAEVARVRGEPDTAQGHLAEALELIVGLQDQPLLGYALHGAAAVAADQDRVSPAIRLLGAAEAVERACGSPPWPAVVAGDQRWLSGVVARYGRPRAHALRTAGETLSAAEAVALATRRIDAHLAPLTEREQHIAGLVAHGLTNRGIAAQLVISARTVDGHVARILTKLGFSTRAQIAAWATEQRAMTGH